MLDNAHLDKFLVAEAEWCLQLVNYSYISRQKIITGKHGRYVYASSPGYMTKSTYSQNPIERHLTSSAIKVREQKSCIIQYFDLPPPWICRHKLQSTNSGAISGVKW